MKKYLLLIISSILMFLSCQNSNSPLKSDYKIDETTILTNDENYSQNMEVITDYSGVRSVLAKNYTIVGNEGGKIIEKHTWEYGEGRLKLEAYLTIPKGAFDDTLTFEMAFDPNLLSVELHPTPFYFNIPVILDLKFKGLSEYYNIDTSSLDFQYFNLDGTFEDVDYKSAEWDPVYREIKVFDAELHHFSRYGWTRTKR